MKTIMKEFEGYLREMMDVLVFLSILAFVAFLGSFI